MPIDFVRNLIFIHIPKTGGTSIERALGLSGANQFFCYRPLQHLKPENKTPQHFTWRELADNTAPEFFQKARTFSFVRNPWDRLVSEFAWRRPYYYKWRKGRYPCYYDEQQLHDFDAFVRTLELPEDKRIDTHRGFDGHLETQRSYLVDDRGKCRVDFVGRFERLVDDFAVIMKACNVDVPALERLETSEHGPYQSYYTPYSRYMVERFYAEDIKSFGYKY